MSRLPEPDDVDIIVDGRNSDPDSIRETIEYIEEYKRRPGYAAEVEQAKRILDSLKLNSKGDPMPDPAALLDHWRRCVADLTKEERNGHLSDDST
jgi:hypothetical protein